jgi:hypothetical protein
VHVVIHQVIQAQQLHSSRNSSTQANMER